MLIDRMRLFERQLTLNVMDTCATLLNLDLEDDAVCELVYFECCGLNDWNEEHGFGSSDMIVYVDRVRRALEKEKVQ